MIKKKGYKIKNKQYIKYICDKYVGMRWHNFTDIYQEFGYVLPSVIDRQMFNMLLSDIIGAWDLYEEIIQMYKNGYEKDEFMERLNELLNYREKIVDMLWLFSNEEDIALMGDYAEMPEGWERVDCE